MKTTIKNILAPVDLTPTSLNSLNTAIQMAARHEALLHILYVEDIINYYPQMGQLGTIEPVIREIVEKDKYLLEKMAKAIFKDFQVNCWVHSVTGYPTTMVSDMAAEVKADMIVMGTEAGIDKKSYLVDSPVYKVMRAAPCHVLMVPANQTFSAFEHILYPVMSDGTPLANLPVAKVIIEKNNATVSVIRVIQKEDSEVLNSLKMLSDSIRRRSNGVARSARTRPLYTSNPAKGLAKLSREEKAGLVVIEGKTQRSLKEFFTGSFTQKMLRNQDVAVLCTKKKPENDIRSLNAADFKNFQLSY